MDVSGGDLVRTAITANEAMLDVEAAAALLGVQPMTVYRWCRSGRLRCQKPGKAWRIRRADVLAIAQGAAPPETLAEHLGTFLRLPDHVLVVAEDPELLRRVDAALFQLGAAQGARLVKIYDPARTSRHALTSAFRRYGLAVDELDAAGQLQWVAEHDLATGVARLQDVVTADPDVPTWAVFDWVGLTDVAVALTQHEALRALTTAHPLVVATGVIEPEPSYWPPLAQQWQVMATIRGMLRVGQGGLVLSRVTPMPPT